MKITLPFFFIAIFLFFFNNAYSQNSPVAKTGPGHFYGKIIDGSTQKPVDAASIQLLQNNLNKATNKTKDVILAVLLSNKNGDFSIENLPVTGNFILRITAIGYKAFEQTVAFNVSVSGTDKDLGNLKMTQDTTQLQNVTVNTSKPLLELSLDKKIYNVEKDLTAAGGTAVDVMKNIPSVNVDIDGNVTMRNAAPQIFIDGRPTTLTLDQIPAEQIATVEIITNPSAKYDLSGGGAGILNIVLKKNRKTGYNGNIRAGIDRRGKPNFGGDINLKQNKINFFSSLQVVAVRSITNVKTVRTDFLGTDSTAHFLQQNKPAGNGVYAFGRLGFDYFIDNRNTFTISANGFTGRFKVRDLININSDTLGPVTTFIESAKRTLKADIGFNNLGASIGFKHNFARPGKEWSADANYVFSNNTNTSDYNSELFDQNNYPKPPQGALRATGGGKSKNYTVQTDYTDPFTKTQKIEFGLRTAIRNYTNWNDNYLEDPNTNIYNLLPLIGVKYNFKDQVYAAYATYSQQLKKFSYQAGIRVESSEYSGDLITKNQQFSTKYPFSFFPSLYMSYKLNDKQDMQVNYSRKINRPNFFQLVPFVDFSDSLNLSVGNPALKPEFTNLAEIVYSNQYSPGNSLLVSLYGKITDNLITRYQFDSLINPAKTARYITYANANKSYTAGLEITSQNTISKWWGLTANLNLFNVDIRAGNLPGVTNSSLFTWFGKLNNSFKLPKNYSIQLTGDYQAKTLIPASGSSGGGGFGGPPPTTAQGYVKPIGGVDIAIRKDFLKNNTASLTLQFSDIFRSRTFTTHAETAFFVQENSRLRDPQLVRLNFSWRFGKVDVNLFKRKNLKGEQEAIQGVQSAGQ